MKENTFVVEIGYGGRCMENTASFISVVVVSVVDFSDKFFTFHRRIVVVFVSIVFTQLLSQRSYLNAAAY